MHPVSKSGQELHSKDIYLSRLRNSETRTTDCINLCETCYAVIAFGGVPAFQPHWDTATDLLSMEGLLLPLPGKSVV
jgi:hypothetical protein